MTHTPTDARALLEELLAERILLLDGSMGALILSRRPTEEDYRGNVFKNHPVALRNCTEALVLSQPTLIEDLHRAYLDAGADIIETCTFNGNALSLFEFALQDRVHAVNVRAAELARRAADDFTRRTPRKPRFVAGSIGPTNKLLTAGIDDDPSRGNVTYGQMVEVYYEQVRALVEGGVDILLPETAFDTVVQKACLFAIAKYFDHTGRRLPVMISGTVFETGQTLSGQSVEAYYTAVSHFDALSVGLNCAVGVDKMRPALESLAQVARRPVSCHPNAGMPDGFDGFTGTKEQMVQAMGEFARNGWVNLVGGCCGTTPEWIHNIAKVVEG